MKNVLSRSLPVTIQDLTAGELQNSATLNQASKLSTLERNNLKWEVLKDDIQRIYVHEDKTLKETMHYMEQASGFKSSERKWKVKLKEWNFEKNISAKEMSFMVEKAEKRKRDEGKYTTFLRGGMEIPKEKFDQHKRRKVANHMEAGSSIVQTPPNITYHTPKSYFLVDNSSIQYNLGPADDARTPSSISPEAAPSISNTMVSATVMSTDEAIQESPDGKVEPSVLLNAVSTDPSQLFPRESEAAQLLYSIRERGRSLESEGDLNMAAANRQDAQAVSVADSKDNSPILIAQFAPLDSARDLMNDVRFFDSANLYLTTLYKSFEPSDNKLIMTSLDEAAFGECMMGALRYINQRRRHQNQHDHSDQDTNITFQNLFDSTKFRASPQGCFEVAERKLEFIFCGLSNYQEGVRSVAAQTICEALVCSFPQEGSHNELWQWRCRLALGRVLSEREFHRDAIQELVRAAAACLKFGEPGGKVLETLRAACRRSPFRKELSSVISDMCERVYRADQQLTRYDVQVLYPIMKLAVRCLELEWWACGNELLESVLLNLGNTNYSYRRRNWIELYLHLFQLCYKHGDYAQATWAISTAYRITDMILPCRRAARVRGLIMDLPWHRSWIKIARPEFYLSLHTNTVQEITEVNLRLGNNDCEAWRSVELLENLKEYSEDEGLDAKSETDSDDEESEDDTRAMKAAEFGLTYTESLSPSLTMDHSSLFPRRLKEEHSIGIKVERNIAV